MLARPSRRYLIMGAAAYAHCSMLPRAPLRAATFSGSESRNPWSGIDGHLDAPTGIVQHPTLLNGYPRASAPNARTPWPLNGAQPPWMVAGVDYYVGVSMNESLQDASKARLPVGWSRDSTTRVITISGSNGVIRNWDFSGGGGYRVQIHDDGCTVTNCKFAGASKDGFQPLLFQVNRGNAPHGTLGQTVRNCTFDGAGGDSSLFPGLISQDGRDANLTVMHSDIKNADSDAISAGGGNTVIKYNLIEVLGNGKDSHPDGLQNTGSDNAWALEFNTLYEPMKSTQGFIIADHPFVGNSTVRYNTFIGNAGSYFVGAQTTCSGLLTISENYADVQSGGFAYPDSVKRAGGSSHCVFFANMNLTDGSAFSNNP